MSDPPSYDQDLLSRLNKLKKTNISFDQTNPPKTIFQQSPASPESTLSDRLRGLRNASLSSSLSSPLANPRSDGEPAIQQPLLPSVPTRIHTVNDPMRQPIDLDEKTLDELLADLGPDDQWKLDPEDPQNIQRLLDEAKNATSPDDVSGKIAQVRSTKTENNPETSKPEASEWNQKYLSKDIDFSVFRNSDDEDEQKEAAKNGEENVEAKHSTKSEAEEDLEADEIVRRMLEEVSLEKEARQSPGQSIAPKPAANKDAEISSTNDSFSLPSAPRDLPSPSLDAQPSKKSLDFESDISARMAALQGLSTNNLGLPSAPSFKPSDRPITRVTKRPDFTDEEIDSWCFICQDDATVKCMGCEGDLYCANCWKEGHMGPDAGYEEKRHKWTKYKKPL